MGWFNQHIHEVLQLRRAAEDELQSALSRSEKTPWSLVVDAMWFNETKSHGYVNFWHEAFLEFSSGGKMWWRWVLCRRCQTEADLDFKQLWRNARGWTFDKSWNVSKRYSFGNTWNWIDQSVRPLVIQGSKIWWILWFLGKQIFWISWISCVATHSLISKNKEWHRTKSKWKVKLRETHSLSMFTKANSCKWYQNKSNNSSTTIFCFPFYFIFWGICWLLLFSKKIRNGKPRWRSPGTRIGLNIHTAERQVLRLKELQARGVFFLRGGICVKRQFLGERPRVWVWWRFQSVL